MITDTTPEIFFIEKEGTQFSHDTLIRLLYSLTITLVILDELSENHLVYVRSPH